MGRRREKHSDEVATDLPITPMLDMAFQLMAFFVFTFRPSATEGQISLYLPDPKGGPTITTSQPLTDPLEEKQEYTVKVASSGGGDDKSQTSEIASITFSNKSGDEALGTLPSRLLEKLRSIPRREGENISVKIEADDNLSYTHLITLMDVCIKAGFPSVGVAQMPVSK